MNSVAYVAQARDWSVALEDREVARTGLKLPDARKAVSQRISVPPGTLRNLRKNRVKGIAVHWYERIRAAVISDLQAEMRRLQHEQHVLQQSGAHPAGDEASAVVASIQAVRLALGLPVLPDQEGGGK